MPLQRAILHVSMPDAPGNIEQPVARGKRLSSRHISVRRIPDDLQILMIDGREHTRGFLRGGYVAGVFVFEADD